MKTKNLMTVELKTVPAGTDLFTAYDIMKKLNIRHLPVLNDEKIVMGILSDRDVQRAMIITENGAVEQSFRFRENDKVENYMSWPAITIPQQADVSQAAQMMIDKKISSLLVTNDQGEVRGILTVDDLLRYLSESEKDQNIKILHFLPEDTRYDFRAFKASSSI